jgi:hypothetical protein
MAAAPSACLSVECALLLKVLSCIVLHLRMPLLCVVAAVAFGKHPACAVFAAAAAAAAGAGS